MKNPRVYSGRLTMLLSRQMCN